MTPQPPTPSSRPSRDERDTAVSRRASALSPHLKPSPKQSRTHRSHTNRAAAANRSASPTHRASASRAATRISGDAAAATEPQRTTAADPITLPSPQDAPLVSITIRTTGIHPSTGRLLALSAALIDPQGRIQHHWQHDFAPHGDIGPLHLYGPTAQELATQKPFAAYLEQVHELLSGRTVICHDRPFTWGFITHEMRLARRSRPDLRSPENKRLAKQLARLTPVSVIDTLATSRRQGYVQPSERLRAVAQWYGLCTHATDETNPLHTSAFNDAIATHIGPSRRSQHGHIDPRELLRADALLTAALLAEQLTREATDTASAESVPSTQSLDASTAEQTASAPESHTKSESHTAPADLTVGTFIPLLMAVGPRSALETVAPLSNDGSDNSADRALDNASGSSLQDAGQAKNETLARDGGKERPDSEAEDSNQSTPSSANRRRRGNNDRRNRSALPRINRLMPSGMAPNSYGLQCSKTAVAATSARPALDNPGIYTPETGLQPGMVFCLAPEITFDRDRLIQQGLRAGLFYVDQLTRPTSVVVFNGPEPISGKAMHAHRKSIPIVTDQEFYQLVRDLLKRNPPSAADRNQDHNQGQDRGQDRGQRRNQSRGQDRNRGRGRGRNRGATNTAPNTAANTAPKSAADSTPVPSMSPAQSTDTRGPQAQHGPKNEEGSPKNNKGGRRRGRGRGRRSRGRGRGPNKNNQQGSGSNNS